MGGLHASYDAVDGAGMSLRDYFAAAALPEVIRLASTMGYTHEGGSKVTADGRNELPWPPAAARCAYQVADAMLAERERG